MAIHEAVPYCWLATCVTAYEPSVLLPYTAKPAGMRIDPEVTLAGTRNGRKLWMPKGPEGLRKL